MTSAVAVTDMGNTTTQPSGFSSSDRSSSKKKDKIHYKLCQNVFSDGENNVTCIKYRKNNYKGHPAYNRLPSM